MCRVWDMRTKVQVHCLAGHDDTVASILANPTSPEVCCQQSLQGSVCSAVLTHSQCLNDHSHQPRGVPHFQSGAQLEGSDPMSWSMTQAWAHA